MYVNGVITALKNAMRVERKVTPGPPYRPQPNGIVERTNGEVVRHLMALVLELKEDEQWSKKLPLVQRILNLKPHSVTGIAPMRMLYGDMVAANGNLFAPEVLSAKDRTNQAYVDDMVAAQRKLLAASNRHQETVVQKYLQTAQPRADELTSFDAGDLVLVKYPSRRPSKLLAPWKGPMAVVEGEPGGLHVVQDLLSGKTSDVHVSRLKKFVQVEGVDPKDIAAYDNGEDVVEAVVEADVPGKRCQDWSFRVRWKGYDEESDTWEPWEHVKGLEALDVFLSRYPKLGKISPKLRVS